MYLSLSDRKEFLEMLHMANQLLHSVPVGAYPTLEVEWLHITSWNRALGEVFLGNDLYTRSVLDLSVKFARRGGLLSGRELVCTSTAYICLYKCIHTGLKVLD